MNVASRFAEAWLDWAVAASWQLALLVCVIAALALALRNASPRLRHGLWLLVLVKAFLPPSLAAFWSVGTWGVAPVVEANWPAGVAVLDESAREAATAVRPATAIDGAVRSISTPALLLVIWAAGCAALWLAVAWRYRRLAHMTATMRPIDEGPARVELERLATRFGVRNVPELYATTSATSPLLMGVLRPKIVLPESILERLDARELRLVLAHELAHWRRHDTWIGWLQVLVQGLFWFHPLVWWANAQIRHERECACDEAVLRQAQCDRDGYGETILSVLAAARGRSLAMANMVGVFERGSQLQDRLEEIMNFDPTKRRFGWWSRAALVVAALVLLPMAAPDVQADGSADAAAAPAASGGESADAQPARPKTNWPVIVETKPKIGATDVDPNLKEISVTFDRDMNVGGYSWTGGGPFYPPGPPDSTPVWIDKRTCVMPVKLEKGSFYRVGINSTSFQNFRSELGVPAPTSAVFFATAGASRTVANRVRVPQVEKMVPENGATDVDPGLSVIRVTFDMSMDMSGYSWTGGGPTYPDFPEGANVRWSRDAKTCMLPVKLKPGWQYELGLNSVHHKNFTSKWGVPLEPVAYSFHTAGVPERTDE